MNEMERKLLNSCRLGDMLAVQECIYGGVDVDILHDMAFDGCSPLMLAALAGDIDIVKLLIKSGANLNIEDASGWKATTAANQGKFYEIVSLLVEKGVDIEKDFERASEDHDVRFMYYLDPGIVKEVTYGNSLLMDCCDISDDDGAFFLIEKGADIYLKNIEGVSAYDVLMRTDYSPGLLQSLKEKLLLESNMDQDESLAMGL